MTDVTADQELSTAPVLPTPAGIPARKRRPGIATVIFELSLLALVVVAALVWQPISDNLTIQHADPAMIALARDSGMSRRGELVFLRAQPQVVSGPQLIKDCSTSNVNNTGASVSGCYSQATNRIYLLDMPPSLHNVEVVTAAYEMLHPVYISLNQGSSKDALNQAIEANYSNLKSDSNLTGLVHSFAKSEPGQRDLELFSILGTQYSNLTPQLTRYYKPYFTNLAVDVADNQQVTGIFKSYQAQLAALHQSIQDEESAAYSAYDQSVAWAHKGSQSMDNYYYNIYSNDYRQASALVSQYNQLVQQNNLLVAAYTGGQPISEAPEPTQQTAQ